MPKSNINISISPVFTGLIFLFLFGFSACSENEISDIEKMKSTGTLPLITGSEIHIEYTDSAILKAKLYSPLLKEFASPDNFTELPMGMYIEFLDPSGNITTRMFSKYARLDKETNIMTARDSVILINVEGEKLQTELLHWNNESKLMYTDAFVQISKKEEILYGEGLEANESFTKYQILRPQGRIALNE